MAGKSTMKSHDNLENHVDALHAYFLLRIFPLRPPFTSMIFPYFKRPFQTRPFFMGSSQPSVSPVSRPKWVRRQSTGLVLHCGLLHLHLDLVAVTDPSWISCWIIGLVPLDPLDWWNIFLTDTYWNSFWNPCVAFDDSYGFGGNHPRMATHFSYFQVSKVSQFSQSWWFPTLISFTVLPESSFSHTFSTVLELPFEVGIFSTAIFRCTQICLILDHMISTWYPQHGR